MPTMYRPIILQVKSVNSILHEKKDDPTKVRLRDGGKRLGVRNVYSANNHGTTDNIFHVWKVFNQNKAQCTQFRPTY